VRLEKSRSGSIPLIQPRPALGEVSRQQFMDPSDQMFRPLRSKTWKRPFSSRLLNRHALTIEPGDLDQLTTFTPEGEQGGPEPGFLQHLLGEHRNPTMPLRISV
jgi:hypothetical protein